MQIIDFEKKGNVVRFYLGEKTPEWLKPSDIYYGDDWDDRPYEHNAGKVYSEFIKGYVDVAFDFDDLVLEPCDGDFYNSSYCKDDMVNRIVPCLIVVPKSIIKDNWSTDFTYWIGCEGIKRYYFGDEINDNIVYI